MSHVRSDLVCASGYEINAKERQIISAVVRKRFVFGDDLAGTGHLSVKYPHGICSVVLCVLGSQGPLTVQLAVDSAEISLVHTVFADSLVYRTQGRRIFRKYHDTAGIAVDSVTKCGSE